MLRRINIIGFWSEVSINFNQIVPGSHHELGLKNILQVGPLILRVATWKNYPHHMKEGSRNEMQSQCDFDVHCRRHPTQYLTVQDL